MKPHLFREGTDVAFFFFTGTRSCSFFNEKKSAKINSTDLFLSFIWDDSGGYTLNLKCKISPS